MCFPGLKSALQKQIMQGKLNLGELVCGANALYNCMSKYLQVMS